MNNIASQRKKLGITQADLARQLRWSQSRIANYESGARTPTLSVCRKIITALNELGAECTLDGVFPPQAA